MSEIASAFVTLVPTFRGGPGRISQELDGPAEQAGRRSGARMGDGMRSGFAPKMKLLAAGLAGGLAVGVGALVGFAKTGVDAFARVEDATAAAGTAFGQKALPQIEKFAEGAAANFGISKGAALDAALTFGTMGKSAGLTGKDLGAFSTKFAGLAGDMASFRGTSPEQAVQAIGAALRGETEPIRAYGVLLDDASLRQEALKQGLIKTTKDALTPQQKVLAAQALIWKQTKDAQGDFARTSDSTANTQKRLAAETENAQARLGKQLAPAVTLARQAFLGLLTGASSLADRIGPFMGRVTGAVKGLFELFAHRDITGGLLRAFGLEEDSPAVAKLLAVRDAMVSMKDFVVGSLIPAVRDFGAVVLPIVVAVLGKVAAAIVSVTKFFREHQTTAKVLAVIVGGLIVAAYTAMGVAAVINTAKAVTGWIRQAFAANTSATVQTRSVTRIILGWVGTAAAATWNAAKVVASWVATAAGAVAAGVVMAAQVARQVAAWVLLGIQSLLNAARVAAAWVIAMGPIAWVIAAVIGLVVLIIKNWDTIKRVTAAAWSWFVDKIRAALKLVVGYLLNFTGPGLIIKHWDKIKAVTSAAWTAIKNAVSGGISGIITYFREFPRRVLSAMGNLGSLLVDAGKKLIEGLINGIKSMFGKVKGTLGDLTGKLTSWKGPPRRDQRLLFGAGQLIIGGFLRGLESQYGAVQRSLGGFTSGLEATADLTGRVGVTPLLPNELRTATLGHISGPTDGTDASRPTLPPIVQNNYGIDHLEANRHLARELVLAASGF